MTGQIAELTDQCSELKRAAQEKEIALRHIKDVINYRDKEQEIGNCLLQRSQFIRKYPKIPKTLTGIAAGTISSEIQMKAEERARVRK